MVDEQDLAALALTSRLVDSATKPLSSPEFWALCRGGEPSALHGMSASEIAAELSVPSEDAERIAELFDRAGGLAIALEKLDHAGIWTITGVGERYPQRLRTRLGDAAPAVLHGAGDTSLLDVDGVGVVGSRDISADGSQVAREIAQGAVKLGLPVVSGAARGVDGDAMNAAYEAGGRVVGVLADALEQAVTRRSTRRGVAGGQICLVTPYPPKRWVLCRKCDGAQQDHLWSLALHDCGCQRPRDGRHVGGRNGSAQEWVRSRRLVDGTGYRRGQWRPRPARCRRTVRRQPPR